MRGLSLLPSRHGQTVRKEEEREREEEGWGEVGEFPLTRFRMFGFFLDVDSAKGRFFSSLSATTLANVLTDSDAVLLVCFTGMMNSFSSFRLPEFGVRTPISWQAFLAPQDVASASNVTDDEGEGEREAGVVFLVF